MKKPLTIKQIRDNFDPPWLCPTTSDHLKEFYEKGFDDCLDIINPLIMELKNKARHTCTCPVSSCVRKIISYLDYTIGCTCGLDEIKLRLEELLKE